MVEEEAALLMPESPAPGSTFFQTVQKLVEQRDNILQTQEPEGLWCKEMSL